MSKPYRSNTLGFTPLFVYNFYIILVYISKSHVLTYEGKTVKILQEQPQLKLLVSRLNTDGPTEEANAGS